MNLMEPKFTLGKTYATAAVAAWAERQGIDLARYLRRHHYGDWGDLDEEDKRANEDALTDETRIFSCYLIGGEKIYLITEADRSHTTVLFATEY
jgi:hypothetical protein